MPAEDQVKINIKFTQEGEAARQAKAEIDALKNSANAATGPMHGLQQRISGLHLVLSSLTSVISGAANGVRSLVSAIAGMFQVIIAHPIGRLVSVLAMLGVAVYQLYEKFVTGKKGARELADEQKRLEENSKALSNLTLPFETARRDLDAIAQKYREAAAAAKALQSAQDELADAQLATRIAALDLEEEQALGAAGPDEGKRKAIQYEYARRRTDIRYEREAEKAKLEQSERSRAYYAAVNEKEQLEHRLPELQAAAQSYRDRIKRIEETPALQAGLDATIIAGNKQALKEFEDAINAVRERLAALNAEIKPAELAERAAREKRAAIDLEYKTASQRTSRVYAEETTARQRAEYKEFEDAIAKRQKEDAAAAREEAEPRVRLAIQQQRAEAQAAEIRLTAAQKTATAKGQTTRQKQASAANLQFAQAEYQRESADVAIATAYAQKISRSIDPAEIAQLLAAIESIGKNVQNLVSQTTAKANQVASQIKNGGLRNK